MLWVDRDRLNEGRTYKLTHPGRQTFLRVFVGWAAEDFPMGPGDGDQDVQGAVIPFHSSRDPRVFVYVDLGGRCEKGVFEFLRRPEGGWSFDRFVVDEIDIKPLVPKIQKASMETLRLTN